MSADMELQGFENLMAKIENMGKAGDKIYDNALQKSAEPVLKDAQATNAFKDRTGDLRKSLKISRIKKDKNGKYVWIGDVDKKANYSWYVEHKTPFLRPAYEGNKKEIFETIKQKLAEGLKDE